MHEVSASSVAKVVKEEDALTLVWDDGEQSVFPHSWLRENAPENRHPLTGEKLALFDDTRDAGSPWSVSIEYGETLVISWAGFREVNRFPLDALRNSQPSIESIELALAAD